MRKEIKTIAAALTAITALMLFFYIVNIFTRRPGMLSYLPDPPQLKRYALIEAREGHFPAHLPAFLTDAAFAPLRESVSCGALLNLAPQAEKAAMLLVHEELGYVEVYAVYRLSARDMAKLKRGELPEAWKELLRPLRVEKTGGNAWRIWLPQTDSPLYYFTDKENVVLAAGEEPFAELSARRLRKNGSRRDWNEGKKWPGHMELGDGALLLEGKSPVKVEIAWRKLSAKNPSDPAGEAKWTIQGLKAGTQAALLLKARQTEWRISETTFPSSLVMAAGLNIPRLPGSPNGWPFPLSAVANLLRLLELGEDNLREILSGKMILSLGGKNKFLWYTLPGTVVEFTGKEPLMRELVGAFWNNFFLGSEPQKLDGWDYGGFIDAPFSVVGAGAGGKALLGFVSAESLRGTEWLSPRMPDEFRAIGWLAADLPRLGESLGDMARVGSFLTFNESEDEEAEDAQPAEQTPFSRPGLDHSMGGALGTLLRNMGRVIVIWEQPESGSFKWYD